MQQSDAPPLSLPKHPLQRAWVAVQRHGAALLEKVETQVKKAGFPPLEWYDVLWALEREGPLRQRELAGHMLIARYSLSRLIDRMEREDLIERRACPEDGRGRMLHVTKAGLKLRKKIWAVYEPAIADAFGALTAAEAYRLAALLAKLEPDRMRLKQSHT